MRRLKLRTDSWNLSGSAGLDMLGNSSVSFLALASWFDPGKSGFSQNCSSCQGTKKKKKINGYLVKIGKHGVFSEENLCKLMMQE
jgi:hypothetical protein